MAESAEQLYCDRSKLRVNKEKSMARMVESESVAAQVDFELNGEIRDVVCSFK